MSTPWTPWQGQKDAIKFLLQHAYAGLLLDPGLGKTAISYAAFKILKKQKMARRALVIAPMRPLQLVWPAERDKWTDFTDLRLGILHGDYGKKEVTLYRKDVDVFLINPQGLPWLLDQPNWVKVLGADTLVVDELAKFKHTNTSRFKMIKPFLKYFKRRWGLTGSPNANGYEDLFGQAYVLDEGATLGRYITHYRRKYFFSSGFGGYTWSLNEGAEKEIQKAIKPLMLRMEDKDYLKVPRVIDREIWVTLPPAARKVYDDMEEEMFAQIGEGTSSMAVSSASASMKCRQIANGSLYADLDLRNYSKERVVHVIHREKVNALGDLIEELQGTPVLVAYQFQHDLDQFREALGADVPYIGGGVSLKRAAELEGKWNRGELPYLFGQPDSVSHGLNLQGSRGNHVAWFGLTWKYDDYDQMIRRLKRQGSKHSTIFNHRILARNTIDSAMLDALAFKGAEQGEFLKAMKRYAVTRGRKLEPPKRRKPPVTTPIEDDDVPF